MRKRRAKLLSLVLAAGMTVSGISPAIPAVASAKETDQDGQRLQEEAQKDQKEAGEEANNGLAAQYYTTTGSGRDVVLQDLKSNTVDFNINFADLETKLQEQTGRADFAGARWNGRIQVEESGYYTFYGYADNGIRLWINGQQLINYWDGGSWDALQTSEPIYLEAGTYYDFQAEYFDYEGGSHVILYWSNDQSITQREVVPNSTFYLPEDYQGTYITEYDTSEGNLTEGEEFDGHVTVNGRGFTEGMTFEVVKANGSSLSPQVMAEVESFSENQVKLVIPQLSAGTYKIKASEGNTNVVSSSYLIVRPGSESGQTRSERPRADWERSDFVNLNGWWDFSFDPNEVGMEEGWYAADKEMEQTINVPFCWESSLSGVENPDYMGQAWYQRKVVVDESWAGRKMFLKFGAVDWKCKLWVNGQEVGEHVGGYNAFEFDVTDYLKVGEENTITLWVEDKGSYGDDSYPALIGKQGRNAPCGYTHTSGIWQTVGLEARSATYLDNAKAATDIDNSTVSYTLDITTDEAQELTVEYDFESKVYSIEEDQDIPTGSSIQGSQKIQVEAGSSTVNLEQIQVENAKLWNYDDPNLYYGTLTVKDSEGKVLDQVDTYFGMRKVEQKYFDESLGVKYIYLNNKPVYMAGLLDQGFWEEGIYTAPSEEALKYDILEMKEAGFNMIRKHLKVEDPLQYYWCDKLGMMVWQDMPHATAMVPDEEGDETPGRQYYEECLESMMNMNYNHPSIVAVMLFNETWGLQDAYASDAARNVKAADGKSTKDWVEELFYKAKELNPNVLVEDMSACNGDHVQPTELNTYHMYPTTYQDTVNTVERWNGSAFVGSTDNFKFGEKQDGDPLLNSEYGGVGAGSGDFDVSFCFKYMTDIQRRYEKQSGFVYTEPYDIEYERNGFMTYDRKMKVFGYDEIAYGGDMTTKDLTQEIYVGAVDQPIRNVEPGQKMKTKIMAIGWTDELPENIVMKWRFDGTDIYGNNISTGVSGEQSMRLNPYRKTTTTITYNVPTQACVGTLTVWLEDENGNKLAKNFTNVVVADETSENKAYTQTNTDGSIVMKAQVEDSQMDTSEDGTALAYSYTLPEDFALSSLNGMRVLAEASSCKGQIGTDKYVSSYSSAYGQTAEGRERPSDMTVSINGVEVDTVYLPDNPRDMRGTLTLNSPYNGQTSAGNFGYLVNLNISDEQMAAIKDTLTDSRELTVTYEVKEDAENQNGLRIYSSTYGRYAVNPTLILNPTDQSVDGVLAQDQEVDVEGDNYSVEASLESQEGYVLRNDQEGGYQVEISEDGNSVALKNKETGETIASAVLDGTGEAYEVKTTLFDEHIRIYVDNDPEPVIDVYDKSGFTGDVTLGSGAEDAVVSPESYEAVQGEVIEPSEDVNITDDFSDANLDSRYERMGNDLVAEIRDDALWMSAQTGDKLILNDLQMSDGIYEAEITLNSLYEPNGNTGITFRSSNYLLGSDGLDGYYAGLGNGYIQLGRMNNNWTELARVEVPGLETGTTHKLKVSVFGSRIQVYLDDEETPRIDVVDTTYSEGGAAIRGYRSSATVDNLKITNVPEYTSDFAHGIGEWDANGVWKVDEESYQVSSNDSYAFVDSTEQKNVKVSAELKASDEDALPALYVRAQNSAAGLEGYRAVLNVKEDKVQLIKTVQGEESVLAERNWKLDTDKAYRLTVEANGTSLKVYMGDSAQALIAVTDETFETGRVGLYNAQGTSVFDNLSINGDFIDGGLLPEADTSALDELLEKAQALNPEDYTKESYGAVKEAMEAAGQINRYDQTEIDKAAADLKTAIDNLVEEESAFTDLESWIQFAESLTKDAYTQESWAVLEKAIEAAKAVAADETASRSEIDQAISDLVKALGGLEYGVQKQHLQAAVDAAQEILDTASDYEEESLAALRAAVENAKKVLENAGASQDEVNQAASDVIDAIVQVIKDADITALESLLQAVESLDESKYTTESWAALEAAIQAAREVLANQDRTESDLAKAYSDLAEAVRGLEMRGNKAALGAAIEKAQEILEQASRYTESSISGLPAALAEAEAVYNDEDATAQDVNQATTALTSELVKARLKGDVDGNGEVNTSDSTDLLKYAAEMSSLDAQQLDGADVNGDGVADTKDAALILQYSAERISEF